MDQIARISPKERELILREAAARMGLNPVIIEKDFWVCWTLKRLFSIPEIAAHLTFKGGTSLSKGYRLIERFSEDIDISIQRDWLGFGGASSPDAAGISKKERERRLEALIERAQQAIFESVLPSLNSSVQEQLGGEQEWSLKIDAKDKQTVHFHYPRCSGEALAYNPPWVKIEFGVRADHWPTEERELISYAAEKLENVFAAPRFSARVLKPERTFWEKATHLHSLYHLPLGRKLPEKNSRHYYDLSRMIELGVGREAASQTELLARVVEHKSVFFRSAWASYQTAAAGSLRLTPPESRISEWHFDYDKMTQMFFSGPRPFDEILRVVSEFEAEFNATFTPRSQS